MKNVIFINLTDSSFVRLDEEILKKHYRVTSFKFRYKKGIKILIDLIRQFLFMTVHIWKADLIYIWFADFHAVIPTLFGKLFARKVVIVIGGYDAVYDKALNYGAKTRFVGKYSVKIVTALADQLLPVSNHTLNELLKNHNPNLEKKSMVIYNAFNPMFRCNDQIRRENTVATICLTNTKKTLFIKGVDFYVEVAKQMPWVTFQVIGPGGEAKEYLESISSENVVLIERVPPEELREILCRTKVICQFSRHEAFGVALLEGISCGCNPVGYGHAGTKEILSGEFGISIPVLEVNQGKQAIETALGLFDNNQQEKFKLLMEKFSQEKREKRIISFLEEIHL
ncbi:MAG: glycosyltransferase family 4 protein [Bacteroidales bacterium]|nr:glycosyltransferase family 4 protein [Bacteroidales bacterium]